MSRRRPATAVLLDTHTWVWLVNGDGNLSVAARKAVADAATTARVYVSAISTWELGMLEAKGRIRLGRDVLAWISAAVSRPGISLVPLTPEIAVASSRLPGYLHGDPADRILIATARVLPATLITHDARILAYGATEQVAVLAT